MPVLTETFRDQVTSREELTAIIGQPSEMVIRKQLSRLDDHCRRFIALAPFMLLGTANRDGRCDVSPRGDGPGFVLVLDEATLVIPDRPGNRRIDSLQNILDNPEVGLLFVIPGVEETLRVNGHAVITSDEELLARMAVRGKRPSLAVGVTVREAFLHCAKAFKRSRLWQAETWPERSALPSLGRMLLDQTRPANTTAEDLDCSIEEAYRTRLY